MAAAPDRKLVYGTLLDGQGSPIDQVLATVSRGPNSYTGEDTAELQCHGSPMVLTLGLEALCAAGARPAGPGEFTRRAFLNGRAGPPPGGAGGGPWTCLRPRRWEICWRPGPTPPSGRRRGSWGAPSHAGWRRSITAWWT